MLDYAAVVHDGIRRWENKLQQLEMVMQYLVSASVLFPTNGAHGCRIKCVCKCALLGDFETWVEDTSGCTVNGSLAPQPNEIEFNPTGNISNCCSLGPLSDTSALLYF